MRIFCELLKDNKYEFIVLNVDVYDLGYNYACKDAATLFISSCTVEHPITSIFPCIGFAIVSLQSRYLKYELFDDQFCGWEVTALDPITSDLSISCYYIELDEKNATFNAYFIDVVAVGHAVSGTMFIIYKFLIAIFCCY